MTRLRRDKYRHRSLLLAVFILLFGAGDGTARDIKTEKLLAGKNTAANLSATDPVVGYARHSQGNMQLIVRNNGTFGSEWDNVWDPLTGERWESCVYPKNSDLIYLYVCALWIGAVVGRDTLVSCGTEDMYCSYEFWPDVQPFGDPQYQSIDPTNQYYSEDAYSEQDIICEFTDTLVDLAFTNTWWCDGATPHTPLNIKVSQRSMAWSYDYADDFILFDYQIENIGTQRLSQVYMGIWLDGCAFHVTRAWYRYWTDDIVGFYRTHPAEGDCGFLDTINIAYHADNDGDPDEETGEFTDFSPKSVVGVRVVRTPADSLKYSFNWWIMNYDDPTRDFGPRQRGTPEDPFRDFGTRLGTPVGDENRYYILRHDEFDYDLLTVAVDHTDSGRGWLPPPEDAEIYATGFDIRYLLSFGPFDIDPGQKLPISFAWVGGENFHVNPTDFETFNPYLPGGFYNKLNFDEFARNSRWASWIYDNPGVDTDGDGDSGQYRVCCYDTTVTDTGLILSACDTTWYKGDGVPDFRGASPPPAPKIWIESQVGSLRIRFNGTISETTRDPFSGVPDFEGYRIYVGRDDRLPSLSVTASYDRENFNKYVWVATMDEFDLIDLPFTREELQQLYGDPIGIEGFEPLAYGRDNPYFHPQFPDSLFYFTAQDYNQSELGVTTPIRKVYPDQPYPTSLDLDSVQPDELTEEGYLKYYEYEFTLEHLLPTVPYYVNVTVFDFGSPRMDLDPLETSVLNGLEVGYALTPAEAVEEENLKVFVYPNPYRSDAQYEMEGFENRDGTEASDRMRRIHFANLPRVCKISIYSIDGDLVREIDHNYPEGGPQAMHDTWNLITRNTQAAVSGLYYWVVESDQGTQMGKLVIIR